MGKPAVVVDDVSKKFGLSLRSALKYGLTDGLRRLVGVEDRSSLRPGEFWALREVSFSLDPGDALGIMGINGSGKTTLLRILNGTYLPDQGSVTMRGRVGALIAAGAGFSPMLTGRENIYINATLLGMSPAQIKQKFNEIVEFAELGDFIDMPVRNYSSGMSVRLGFAIAVIGSPEVLLVDEVLAVGDISFQKKCFERILSLKRQGTTILVVSHSPGAIWAVCNKGLVIHRGITQGVTSVEEACKTYDDNNSLAKAQSGDTNCDESSLPKDYGGTRGGTGTAFVSKVAILDDTSEPITSIEYGKSFKLRCHVTALERIDQAVLRVQIDGDINKAISVIDNYEIHHSFIDLQPGQHVYEITIAHPQLRPGAYSFASSIIQRNVGVHIFFEYNQAQLRITQCNNMFFYADHRASVQLNASYKRAS